MVTTTPVNTGFIGQGNVAIPNTNVPGYERLNTDQKINKANTLDNFINIMSIKPKDNKRTYFIPLRPYIWR